MTLRPDLVWLDGRFVAGVQVRLSADGRIVAVEGSEPLAGGSGDRGVGPAARSETGERDDALFALPDRALLPGFVNAHSHAFQRLIRGRTQWRPAGSDDTREDFWSWREAMYAAALGLSPEDVYQTARFCFLEMMRTGITAVGEFHYLHHQPDGRPYPDPNELATRVIAAAESVGLRIVLLNVCYATGGIGRPLGDRQRRFRASSIDEYLDRTTALAECLADSSLATVGIAPHSIRAVARDWLPRLRQQAAEAGWPVHMHVSEQPEEVEQCVAEYGLRPVELLAEDGLLDERFTAVHATHLTDSEVELLGDAGTTVCACPTTERDLGDGFLRGLDLLRAGAGIALGTDSHTSLDFLEEMRLVEYHERLQRLRRVVITDDTGGRGEVAPPLLRMATSAGARSLGLEAGVIKPGALADLVAIDLRHHSLAGWTPQSLAAALTLSATPDVVTDTWIGGAHRLRDRRHALDQEVAEAFGSVARARRDASW